MPRKTHRLQKLSSALNSDQPIGVFDSGVGGLTVARAIQTLLPNERLIYFGDTKHLPYGEKSKEAIAGYALRITQFLLEQNCKAIVIACNSATAAAGEEIRKFVGDRALVVDVISPVAEKVAFEIHSKVGVIATKATVNSGLYRKSIRKLNKHIEVAELATPLLVPVIEEGLAHHTVSKEVIRHYLAHRKLGEIESLILGCTHYPLVSHEIKKYYAGKVRLVDSPEIVADFLRSRLMVYGLCNQVAQQEKPVFYLSDITKNFTQTARKFFGRKIIPQLKVLEGQEPPSLTN